MNSEDMDALAAASAIGALDPADEKWLHDHLSEHFELSAGIASFSAVAVALAKTLPRDATPAPAVRARVFEAIRLSERKPTVAREPFDPPVDAKGHSVFRGTTAWRNAVVPGVQFKVVSAAADRDIAVLLVAISAHTSFPEHKHSGYEDLYVISGDLKSEGRVLGPGDCFHAEPGSFHQPLYSETGCTALLILPRSEALALAGG